MGAMERVMDDADVSSLNEWWMEGHCQRWRVQNSTEKKSNWGSFMFEVSLDSPAKVRRNNADRSGHECIIEATFVDENSGNRH